MEVHPAGSDSFFYEKRNLLRIENLRTYFFLEKGTVKAVDGVNVEIGEGETLGLVGESGCGKSVTALSLMRLVPYPGKIIDGSILFDGQDILKLNDEEMRKVRGKKISMIFQDPTAALNPVYKVGEQIAEILQLHEKLSKAEALKRAKEMLDLVGIPSAQDRLEDYPHQLSGGMRQRVMIAMALACNPKMLIADEPTTNLDVTIQAQILELMKELRSKFSSSIMLITHHLGLVAEMCDKVAVMYSGEIVEYTDTKTLFKAPKHPYTQGLLKCIPTVTGRLQSLFYIKGSIPDPFNLPSGCRFHPRCPYAFDRCKTEKPELKEVAPNHKVSCHLYD
ncbi:MAG: ABC transporter ATP-binding protein [Nitrososphaerales archaeon]